MGVPNKPSDCVNLKSVCLLLSLCHAGSAAAFGLGEVSVRSFLGQPLHLTVALLDITPATTASCLSLDASPGGIAPPLRAQLSIEQTGGQTLVHIRSVQSIHDPVVQFVLVSDCEARLQRDYVVLLDPPALVEAVRIVDVPAAAPVAATPIAAPPVASRPARAKPARALSAAPASSGRPLRQSATLRTQASPPPTPRLVLSGKHRTRLAAAPTLALRLDTHLPELAEPRAEGLTATELSDENTALNHKLAHLEAQLTALQQRNAALETRRAATPAKVAPPPSKQPVQWPLYLLAIGLLGGSGILVAWLRQRSRTSRPLAITDIDPWTHTSTLPTLGEMVKIPDPAPSPAPQRMPEIVQPPHEEGTEVKEDILDQAEVFMAHGHGELAIHLLQEHLRAAPAESPVPWLLLLDLLNRSGNTTAYATANTECRRYFNIDLGSNPSPASQDTSSGQGLEAYPHVLEQLVHVWNSPDIEVFFNDLIHDQRGGTRMGFEPGAYRDILLLQAIAKETPSLAA